jgi:leader peptidase (prepilin peptidase)/N-methyltransferase
VIPSSFWLVVAFVFGAVVGSFLNVCIVRWPRELSVVRPPSRCTRCGHRISWYENIPVVSWIALRGRCRCCDESISVLYPAIELTVALGWLLAAWHFGPTLDAFRVAVVGTTLLGIAVTDARHYLIPDGFTVFGLFFVLAMSLVGFLIGSPSELFSGPWDAVVGACAGAGLIAIVGWLGEVAMKREAMGLGDVTLMAFAGAALGPARAILTVFVAAGLGVLTFVVIVYPIAWARRSQLQPQTELALGAGSSFEPPLVPFGVFLAPATLIALLWGNALLSRFIGG